MKAKYDKERSWEKQSFFDLENDCSIRVEYNPFYGPLVTAIADFEGEWFACNGLESLPERFAFARAWIEPITPGHWQRVMKKPRLEIVE